jgi:hypothetical protein
MARICRTPAARATLFPAEEGRSSACASELTTNLNVLACSKRPPAAAAKPHQVILNGADGLDFQSTTDCRFFHIIPKDGVQKIIGRVSHERRRAIGRKINEVLRLLL